MSALNIKKGSTSHSAYDLRSALSEVEESHTLFSAGTRAVLGHFTLDLTLHMTLGTLAGIIGPLILYAAIRRVGRPSWIGF